MKPLEHAERSVKRWGGKVEDFLKLHTLMDFSKSSVPSMTHRVMFHHSAGIWFMEEIFGAYITNSDGKKVATRDIAEQHVIDDLGFIPTLKHWTDTIKEQTWMFAGKANIVLDEGIEKEEIIGPPEPLNPMVPLKPEDFRPPPMRPWPPRPFPPIKPWPPSDLDPSRIID